MDRDLNLSHPDFWESKKSFLFLNPSLAVEEKKRIKEAIRKEDRPQSIWLKSSGTESSSQGHKLVCLSKKAILQGAQAVINFLGMTSQDSWLCVLPNFHVGGLAIFARGFLTGAPVETCLPWEPLSFVRKLKESQISLVSLVPTQVYDLVEKNLAPPLSLRLAIVGGGPLTPTLYKKARHLGWPLLPSYGMTETSALMACASPHSLQRKTFPKLQRLPHITWEKKGDKWALEGPCLYHGFLWIQKGKKTRWEERPRPFLIHDRLELKNGLLSVLGRESELIKILGESVNLLDLEARLSTQLAEEVFLVPLPHGRRGFSLHLVGLKPLSPEKIAKLNKALLPFERIETYTQIPLFPKNALGKIERRELRSCVKIT